MEHINMMMEHGIDVAPHDSDVLPNAGVHVSPRPRDILLQLLGEVQLAEAPNENDSPQMLDHEDACETEYHHHHTPDDDTIEDYDTIEDEDAWSDDDRTDEDARSDGEDDDTALNHHLPQNSALFIDAACHDSTTPQSKHDFLMSVLRTLREDVLQQHYDVLQQHDEAPSTPGPRITPYLVCKADSLISGRVVLAEIKEKQSLERHFISQHDGAPSTPGPRITPCLVFKADPLISGKMVRAELTDEANLRRHMRCHDDEAPSPSNPGARIIPCLAHVRPTH
jgi:hypothetical protein